MEKWLAKRVKQLTPSTTLAITAKAKELKDSGKDVIGLGAGEPDFNTPERIIQAACDAARSGDTKYTPSGGTVALKDAIIAKTKRDSQLTYARNEVMVASGAKHALYALFQSILDEGDEVVIPIPYWVSYPEQVKLAGGTPVYVNTDETTSFKVTPELLEAAITPRTKAVILNSPSNPTGMIYTKAELEALAEVILRHDVLVVSDEIYEKLIYGTDAFVSIAMLDGMRERTVIINGVSKSHAMTGWRIGYAIAEAPLIAAMTNHASHSTSNPTSIAQAAAVEAYNGPQDDVEMMRQSFAERLDVVYDRLVAIPGISCLKPQGAFYLYANAKEAALMSGYDSVDTWCQAVLEEANVALVPGSGFGQEDYVRLSYATKLERVLEALDRVEAFIQSKSAVR